jgi:hypothetical protein
MSMSMLYVYAHAACLCLFCMPMSMLHACVNSACPCPCCISMSMLHGHVHTACSCPCSCCTPMPMLHVHAAFSQTASFWITKYAAICKGDVNRASYDAVPSQMVKIMEVMDILLRDNAVKTCSSFNGRTRPWWSLSAIF